MAAVNGVSEGDKGGPPPPSPLTGCYLLIVIGEPHSKEHKDIILQRIAKGLLSWDVNDCLVDLEKELAIITEQSPEGEEARYGERLIQFASENLVTEVLIHPVVSTLAQCVRNLLSSFTRHRHIIHAGYTFDANGSWILQDGTFSLADFSEAFQELEVQRVIRAYENGISMDIHCSPEGDWNSLPKESFARYCKVRINPNDVLTSGSPSISSFIDYISPFLIPAEIETLLESSDVVGNIRFSHPTLYVFPGGQGDAALFGINGFNMLLDGGFSRKSCFWDFVRHLDRLDAVLLTRLNNSNVNGISAVLRRKKQNAVYPQIGHFFCNIPDKKAVLSPDGDKDKDPLLVNILEEGHEIISNLQHLSLPPQSCYRDSEPINLYHKVGHGTLDMYVLSPAKDSKEVREFMHKWNNNDQKLFAYPKNNKDFLFPVQNLVSICALLVWQPANPEDNITRILYPGSTPQQKIFEGLDKIKHLGFIKHPICSESSLTPSISATALKAKSIIDRIVPEQKPPKKIFENKQKEKLTKDTKLENKIIENGDTTDLIEKQIKKSESTEGDKIAPKVQKPKKLDTEKEVIEKTEEKPKTKPKDEPKTKVDIKPKQRSESQQRKPRVPEKKASPTTPKKTIDSKINGEAPKSKLVGKASPQATPAKSAKEASNRRVVESKYKQTHKPPPKPVPEKKERKPVTRKAKEATSSAKPPSSPLKKVNGVAKSEVVTRKARLDKEGTTDSSTVSTPSADQESLLKKDISKLTPEEIEKLKAQELADLKEEQEVVKEIEAVFRKGEIEKDTFSDVRKIKDLSVEEKEKEEYLVIEKEEIIHTKEDEIQKLTRDSEESEKQKPPVEEEIVTAKEAEPAAETKEKVVTSKEESIASPEDKIDTSSERKTNDRDVEEFNKEVVESQPDEKVSGNVESGATTTAPTLPEDERIPLDEIKEDQAIEEKYVKEETKEKEVLPVIQLPPKAFDAIPKLPPVVGIRLDKHTNIRDLVKTPDEVADLPVHEEVDINNYEEYRAVESAKELAQYEKYDEKEKGDEPKVDTDLKRDEPIKEKEAGIKVEETPAAIAKETEGKTEIKKAEVPVVIEQPKQEVLKEQTEEISKPPQPIVKKELVTKEEDQKAKSEMLDKKEIKEIAGKGHEEKIEELEELEEIEKAKDIIVKEESTQITKEIESSQITRNKDVKEVVELDRKVEDLVAKQEFQPITKEEEPKKIPKEEDLKETVEDLKLDKMTDELAVKQEHTKIAVEEELKEITGKGVLKENIKEAKLDTKSEDLAAKQESIQVTKEEESNQVTREFLKESTGEELAAKQEPIQTTMEEKSKKIIDIGHRKENVEGANLEDDLKEKIQDLKLDKKTEELATQKKPIQGVETSALITEEFRIYDPAKGTERAEEKETATLTKEETQSPLEKKAVLKDEKIAHKDEFDEAPKVEDLTTQKDVLAKDTEKNEKKQQPNDTKKEQPVIKVEDRVDPVKKQDELPTKEETVRQTEKDVLKDEIKKESDTKGTENKSQIEAEEKAEVTKVEDAKTDTKLTKEIQQEKDKKDKTFDILTEAELNDSKIKAKDRLSEKKSEKEEEAIAKQEKPLGLETAATEVPKSKHIVQENDGAAEKEGKKVSEDEVVKTVDQKESEKDKHEEASALEAATEEEAALNKEETVLKSHNEIKEADITYVSKEIAKDIFTTKDQIVQLPKVTEGEKDTDAKKLEALDEATVKEVKSASIEQEIAFKKDITKDPKQKVPQKDKPEVVEEYEHVIEKEKEPPLQKSEQEEGKEEVIITKETSAVKENKITEIESLLKSEPNVPAKEVAEVVKEIPEGLSSPTEAKEPVIAKVELEKQATQHIDLKATTEAATDVSKPIEEEKVEEEKQDKLKEDFPSISESEAKAEQKQLENDGNKELKKQIITPEVQTDAKKQTEHQEMKTDDDKAESALDKMGEVEKSSAPEAFKEGEKPKDMVAPETKPASEVISGILEVKGVTDEKKPSDKDDKEVKQDNDDKVVKDVDQLETEAFDEKYCQDVKESESMEVDKKFVEDAKQREKEGVDEKFVKDFKQPEKLETNEKFEEISKQLEKEDVAEKFAKDSKQSEKMEIDENLVKDAKQPEKEKVDEKPLIDDKHPKMDKTDDKSLNDTERLEKREADEKALVDDKHPEKDEINVKFTKDVEQPEEREVDEKLVADSEQAEKVEVVEKPVREEKQLEKREADEKLVRDAKQPEKGESEEKLDKDAKQLENVETYEKLIKDAKQPEKGEADEKLVKDARQPEKGEADEKLVKGAKEPEEGEADETFVKDAKEPEEKEADDKLVQDATQTEKGEADDKLVTDAIQPEKEDVDENLIKDGKYLEQEEADEKFVRDVKEPQKEKVDEKLPKDGQHPEKAQTDEKISKHAKQTEKVDVDEKLAKDIEQAEKETTVEMFTEDGDQQEKKESDKQLFKEPLFEQATATEPKSTTQDELLFNAHYIPTAEIQDRKESISNEHEKLIVKYVLEDTQQVAQVDKKLQELKSKVDDVSDVISTEAKAVTVEAKDIPILKSVELIEKIDLGSKSPKEREQDVAIIVATVAEVLKSDAPLEELEEKVIIPSISSFTTYTTQLRETHITTQDSAPSDALKKDEQEEHFDNKISATSAFLEQERKINTDPTAVERSSNLIEDSRNLMQETSKLIADIKSGKAEGVSLEKTDSIESGTVHRMLVTASSEDGGEETVICPVGSIVFSRSSESSGRSSPDIQSDSVSTVKTSIDLKDEGDAKKVQPEAKNESEIRIAQQPHQNEKEAKIIVDKAGTEISEKDDADSVDNKNMLKDDINKGQEVLMEKKESVSIYKELEEVVDEAHERIVEEVSGVAAKEEIEPEGESLKDKADKTCKPKTTVTQDIKIEEKRSQEAAKDEKQKPDDFGADVDRTQEIKQEQKASKSSIEDDIKAQPSTTEIAKDIEPKTSEISVDEAKQVKEEILGGYTIVKAVVDSGNDQVEDVSSIVKKEQDIETQVKGAPSSEEGKTAVGEKSAQKQESLQEEHKLSDDTPYLTKDTTEKTEKPEVEYALPSEQTSDATTSVPQTFSDEGTKDNKVKTEKIDVLAASLHKEGKEEEFAKSDPKLPVISPAVSGTEDKLEKESTIATKLPKESEDIHVKLSETTPHQGEIKNESLSGKDDGQILTYSENFQEKGKDDVEKTQVLATVAEPVQEKEQLQKSDAAAELSKANEKLDIKETGARETVESAEVEKSFDKKEDIVKSANSSFSVEPEVKPVQEDKTSTKCQEKDKVDVEIKVESAVGEKEEKGQLVEVVGQKTGADTKQKDRKETNEEKIILAKELESSSLTKTIDTKSNVDEKTDLVSVIKEKDEQETTTEPDSSVQKDKKGDNKLEDLSLASELSDSAGPSRRKDSLTSHLSPSKTSTEDLNLSGKSTPDIADVERMREMQEILKHEKHIPGSCTPPTVPVSPVVKDEGDSTKGDVKKSAETSPLSSIKDTDVRSITPASDDCERSDISSGQVSRAAHLLEAERNDSEEDFPGSPNSITSQLAHSHSTLQYEFEESVKLQGNIDPMNASFYGSLPDDPVHKDSGNFMDVADIDFEKAMHEHRQARGEDLGRETSSSYLFEVTKAKYGTSGSSGPSSIHEEFDSLMTSSFIGELPSSQTDADDTLKKWGKPLGLPSPAPPNDNKGTPKKERKLPPHVTAKNKINDDRKRAESPKNKQKKTHAVYVDLTYVPHHGNSNYSYVDFFKRVRARYYVFSGIEPSKEVYNALLEAKQTWEDKDLEVTIIPTYDTDILGYWVAENEDLLAKYKIDLSPSASRCTINLQDHETSCSAYRLEF